MWQDLAAIKQADLLQGDVIVVTEVWRRAARLPRPGMGEGGLEFGGQRRDVGTFLRPDIAVQLEQPAQRRQLGVRHMTGGTGKAGLAGKARDGGGLGARHHEQRNHAE
jgi:hypothetical protein